MSYLVLARKYRPQNFEEVVGQDIITRTLKNALKMNRVPHALLFTGPRGVGKTTMARLLAKALNCEKGPTDQPCGECPPCQGITQGTNMDVLEIDGASNTGVDDVRQLRESVQYRPSQSRYKVYIIDEVHMLSKGAFNALLKTLEEPPEHCFFIFATTEPHKVPQTIQSRCQRFDFRRIPPQVIVKKLKEIAEQEGIKISDSGLRLLARQAEGSLRDAISLLDQAVSFSGKEISEEKLFELLACVNREYLFELSKALIESKPQKALEILEQTYRTGYDLKQFLKEFIDHFRNLLIVKFTENPQELTDLSEAEINELKKQANLASEEALSLIFEFLLQAEERMARTEHPKVVLEHTLVKSASIQPALKIEELIARLEELKTSLRNKELLQKEDLELKEGNIPNIPDEPENKPSSAQDTGSLSETKSWEGFLEYLSSDSPRIFGILRNGILLKKEKNKIIMEFKDNDFCLELLKEERKEISELASKYFQENLTLEIILPENPSEQKNPPAPGIEREEQKKKMVEHPLVQKAIQLFGAHLEEVKIK